MDLLTILLRWLHIASAAFLVGSLLERLFDAPDLVFVSASRAARTATHAAAGFLIAAGLVNYMRMLAVEPPPGYHMLVGMKILLGLVVAGIAEALVAARGADSPVARRAHVLALVGSLAGLLAILLGVVAAALRGAA
jgi:hypothetical protein